jgi:hypothetical protein
MNLGLEKYLSPCVSPICNNLGITGFSLRGTIKRTGSGRLNGTNILLGTKKRCRLVPKNESNLVHKPSTPLMPDGKSEYFALNEGLRRGKSRMRTQALAGRHK